MYVVMKVSIESITVSLDEVQNISVVFFFQ